MFLCCGCPECVNCDFMTGLFFAFGVSKHDKADSEALLPQNLKTMTVHIVTYCLRKD